METSTLVNRLKLFMEYTGLSNTQFADAAGIARPTLSQILSGRNKKISNELIDKLHLSFPQLNVIWLLFGEGTMTVNVNSENTPIKAPENRTVANKTGNDREQSLENASKCSQQTTLFDYDMPAPETAVQSPVPSNETDKRVERIVPSPEGADRKVISIMVFYSDNSFEVFKPEHTD